MAHHAAACTHSPPSEVPTGRETCELHTCVCTVLPCQHPTSLPSHHCLTRYGLYLPAVCEVECIIRYLCVCVWIRVCQCQGSGFRGCTWTLHVVQLGSKLFKWIPSCHIVFQPGCFFLRTASTEETAFSLPVFTGCGWSSKQTWVDFSKLTVAKCVLQSEWLGHGYLIRVTWFTKSIAVLLSDTCHMDYKKHSLLSFDTCHMNYKELLYGVAWECNLSAVVVFWSAFRAQF